MTTFAPVGQQIPCIAADTTKILRAILAVVDKLDDGEPLKILLTKDEDMPSKLAHSLVVLNPGEEIEEIYSKLHNYLASDQSDLVVEVAWLFKPVIGPSHSERDHAHKWIRRRIEDCLRRISTTVPPETFEYWEHVAFVLETNAYNETLDKSEYIEVTNKIGMVLKHCKGINPRDDDDMKSRLLQEKCVDDDFWERMDGESTDDASEEEHDDDAAMDLSNQPEYGSSPNSTGVIPVELQQKSWSRVEKALRSCMGRFPYPEHNDVRHKYYILNARELENARFFAEEDIRVGHADSVRKYQAGVEDLITQINDWGELELWEHWHDYTNQLLDRANEPAEYCSVNNEELNREMEKLEKHEKLRDQRKSNQEGHLEAISRGNAYSSPESGATVAEQEESAPFATFSPTTKHESARASSSKDRTGDGKTDDSRTLSDPQTRVEHSFQTQGLPTVMSSHARLLSASPQLGERPAPGDAMKIATKEQASLLLVGLFQNFVSVLQEGSSGHDLLERIAPGILARRISETAFMTPETANEVIRDLVDRLEIILRDSCASGDDELIAVLQADAKWLRPSVEERRQASREMRMNIKKCNAKLPVAEALTIPHIKQVNKDGEFLLFEKAIDFIEYKNMCDAIAHDAAQCCHQLPDNIGLWRHLLLTYLPEDHDLRPITTPLASCEQPSVDVSKEHSNLAQPATCPVPSIGSTDLTSGPSKSLNQDMEVDSAVVSNTSSTQGVGASKHNATSGVSVTQPVVAPSAHDGMDVDDPIDETQKPSQVSTARGTTMNGSHSAVSLPQPAASQFYPSYGAGSTNEPTTNTLRFSSIPNVTARDSHPSAQLEPVPTVAKPWEPALRSNRFPVRDRGAVHSGRRREQMQRAIQERILENRRSNLAWRHLIRAERENNSTRNKATERNAIESDSDQSDSNQGGSIQSGTPEMNAPKVDTSESDTPQRNVSEVDTPPNDATEGDPPILPALSDLPAAPIIVAGSVDTAKLAADVQALNSKLEYLEKMMSQRQRRDLKRLRDAKKQSRRSHTRLCGAANLARNRLDRLERSQEEAYAYNEDLRRRDLEIIARKMEVTTRENKIIAQQKEVIALQKEMAAQQKVMTAREKEMVTLQKDMVARQKDMTARQKKLDEREQLVGTRLQAIEEQAMVFAHTPDSVSQQETTTASAKNPSQSKVQEHAVATSDTLKASHSSARSALSAAQAATVPAILQHPQAPRGFLPPKTEVQQSNSDGLLSILLRILAKICACIPSSLTKGILAWAA